MAAHSSPRVRRTIYGTNRTLDVPKIDRNSDKRVRRICPMIADEGRPVSLETWVLATGQTFAEFAVEFQ